MIDFLRGQIAHRETEYLVLDVGGVGYRVFCANPYAVLGSESGQLVTMFIHHHVREDAILLFGFSTREEQGLFRKLLEVSGIGPKVAIGILAAGRPEAVVTAIYQEDLTFLMKLPGIGKKTAQRIILDLKDKLADLPLSEPTGRGSTTVAQASGMTTKAGPHAIWNEAKLALLALGYSEAETDRVWPQIKDKTDETSSVDMVVKLALQVLFRG